jgi:DNA sulfur modification protein DndC
MKTLFDSDRSTIDNALAQTIDTINTFGANYDRWAVSFSGGKDSSCVVSLLAVLLKQGAIHKPKSVEVMYADTGLEIPPLHENAISILRVLREEHGFTTTILRPPIEDRFFTYMLGRGVAPPQSGFRWCVGNLKLEPMEKHLASLSAEGRFLTFTGVRVGESAARDERIRISCTRDGAECSQGHLQYSRQAEKVTDLCHPIIHWRVCQVWEWLISAEVEHGIPTFLLAQTYGGDEAQEINARTGCIQCNVAKRDLALEGLIARPEWAYLAPLAQLREVYHNLSMPHSRHRKRGGEINSDGSLCKNQNRLGPLTMEAREWGLHRVLEIQQQVNHGTPAGREHVSLISLEEEAYIRWAWSVGLYPRKWDGSEPLGSDPYETVFPDGSIQPLLF